MGGRGAWCGTRRRRRKRKEEKGGVCTPGSMGGLFALGEGALFQKTIRFHFPAPMYGVTFPAPMYTVFLSPLRCTVPLVLWAADQHRLWTETISPYPPTPYPPMVPSQEGALSKRVTYQSGAHRSVYRKTSFIRTSSHPAPSHLCPPLRTSAHPFAPLPTPSHLCPPLRTSFALQTFT